MKTNNAKTKTATLTFTAITAKATASVFAALFEDTAASLKKSTRLHEVEIPARITDETVRASILEADARFEGAALLAEGVQAQQNAAVMQWKKAGLTKAEASARCKALCLAMGKSEGNARCIASRAVSAARFDKDEKKSKARGARGKRTIEEALLAYAMKALKSEKKAKAALLAAAALIK